jgi:Flp pilus assembly protein TadD
MSLINQMLRDLDQRRGPAAGADVAALHSLGLLGTGGTTRHLGRPGRLVWGVAGIAAVALCWLAGNVTGASNDQTAATLTTQRLPLPPPTPTLNPAGPARGGLRPAKSATEPPSQRSRQAEPQPIAAIEPVSVPEAAHPATTAAKTPATKIATLAPRETADQLFNKAQTALARHDNDIAAHLLQQVLAEDPRYKTAREQLVTLTIRNGQPERAEALLLEGLALSPRHTELAIAYAQLLVERGALAPALAWLQDFAKGGAADADILALQAAIQDRLQRYAEAVDSYRAALRLRPGQAVWWTGLGVALEHSGQSSAALSSYRRAAQLPAQDAVRAFVEQRIQALAGLANRG